MASGREPSTAESESFLILPDVLTWSKLDGDPVNPGSQAGSLLRGNGAYDQGQLADIADFASVDPSSFEEYLQT